ncbi:MAG: hypothetical protein NTU90_08540 [Proteobacteria bacterium]|nr:hypothetical protein [Pseudomonadota bacterium]
MTILPTLLQNVNVKEQQFQPEDVSEAIADTLSAIAEIAGKSIHLA